jgi:hypothetical protein
MRGQHHHVVASSNHHCCRKFVFDALHHPVPRLREANAASRKWPGFPPLSGCATVAETPSLRKTRRILKKVSVGRLPGQRIPAGLFLFAQGDVDGRDRAGLVPIGRINSVDVPRLDLASVSEGGAAIANRPSLNIDLADVSAPRFSGPLQVNARFEAHCPGSFLPSLPGRGYRRLGPRPTGPATHKGAYLVTPQISRRWGLFLARGLAQRYRPSMVDDPDIWRAANLLLKRHGADTAIAAANRADELLGAGDVEGWAVWRRILAAVTELARTAPAEGERVN